MSGTPRRQPWTNLTRVAAAVLVLCVAAASIAASAEQRPDSALLASLADGFAKIDSGRLDDARTIFERAVAQAARRATSAARPKRLAGLAACVRRCATSPQRARHTNARWRSSSAPATIRASAVSGINLGSDAYAQSRPAEARQCYDRALEAFRRAGLPGDEARVLHNLIFLPDRSLDEKLQLIASAVDRARLAGVRSVEGLALAHLGRPAVHANDYAAAMTKLEAALPLLETSGSGRDLRPPLHQLRAAVSRPRRSLPAR